MWQTSRGPKVIRIHLVSPPAVCQGEKTQGERSWKAQTDKNHDGFIHVPITPPYLFSSPQTASTNALSALVLARKAPHIKAADNSVSPIAVIAPAPARIMTWCPHMSPKVSVSLCVTLNGDQLMEKPSKTSSHVQCRAMPRLQENQNI